MGHATYLADTATTGASLVLMAMQQRMGKQKASPSAHEACSREPAAAASPPLLALPITYCFLPASVSSTSWPLRALSKSLPLIQFWASALRSPALSLITTAHTTPRT